MKLLAFLYAVTALLLATGQVCAKEREDIMMKHTTGSPVSDDMTLVAKGGTTIIDAEKADNATKIKKDTQQYSLSDYIIHPLIALRPRVSAIGSGKQAGTATTTPSPWQIFGFNPAQSIGSSVSSLAGWFGNRFPLPSFVDTPVREASTTTTTVKPQVIVDIRQRVPTRKPLATFDNVIYRPSSPEDDFNDEYNDVNDFNRRLINRKKYHHHEVNEDDEIEYTEDDNGKQDEEDDDYNNRDDTEELEDIDEPVTKKTKRRRHSKPLIYSKNKNYSDQKKRLNYNQRKHTTEKDKDEEAEGYNIEDDDYDDDNEEEDFYYNENQESEGSIHNNPEDLFYQIKYFIRASASADTDNSLHVTQSTSNIPHQTIYLAPELIPVAEISNNKDSTTPNKQQTSHFPQPPLTVPYKRKGQPIQYITIPWNQLGISPPDQIVSLTEGVQSQPLILKIPQSAIENMQNRRPNKNKPIITPDAVPLLAEASIMDIFKPPHIPSEHIPTTTDPTQKSSATLTRVVISGGAIVEQAPATDDIEISTTDDSKLPKIFVIADKSGETKLSDSAYKQILDYFNQNRVGRKFNYDAAASLTSQGHEQFVPVKVIFDEEQPDGNNKLEITMKSPLDDATNKAATEEFEIKKAAVPMSKSVESL